MKSFLRFRDWPLRRKFSVFFLGVAALPLLAVTSIEFSNQRQQIIEQTMPIRLAPNGTTHGGYGFARAVG